MRNVKLISYMWVLFISCLFFVPSFTATSNEVVYTVPIHDNVERGLYAFLERAFEEAEQEEANLIVLDVHTPGGEITAAADIAKLIDAQPIETVAYVNTKAHSAGAFIALHADEIYMTADGTMGAAAVIDHAGNAAAQKVNSAWIAQMRSAAELHNRDPQYAQAMADVTLNLPEYRAGEGSLLTLSATEAIEVGYAEGIAPNVDSILAQKGYSDPTIVSMQTTFAEDLARFITNPIIVPLLLSLASLGLVMELYSPGFGVPGAVGITALILFFFGHTVAGFAGYESILLFVVGFILLIAEMFLPGGIVGIVGGGLVITGLLGAGANVTHMAYSILVAMFVAAIGMVITMKFFGKKLHMLNKLVLHDATTTEDGYVSNVNRIDLIGRRGITETPLRPAGVMDIEKERLDVVSDGRFIEKGREVEVVKVEGSRIVVREVE